MGSRHIHTHTHMCAHTHAHIYIYICIYIYIYIYIYFSLLEIMETVTDFIFLGSKITAAGDCSHEIKRPLLFLRKAMTKLDSVLKSGDITLPTKVSIVKTMVFPVVMCRCESWTIKKAEHWRIVAFELWCWRDSWESFGQQGDHIVNPQGNQSWIFIGKTDVEAEAPILWPHDAKNCLIGKDPDTGKDWRQEKKGMTEDELVGWQNQLNGHEFEQALGVGDGQESLACCSPWSHKDSDTTEQLKW